jgi:secreted trypsin-like serine protease
MKVMVRRLLVLTALLALVPSAPAAARVTNGDDAGAGEYPWTVALVFTGEDPVYGQFCGGSLIAPDMVLTAAHCAMGMRADEIDVFAGNVDLRHAQTHPEDMFDVVDVRLPTNAEVDPDDVTAVPRHDMAVLQLDAPVPAAQPIAPVDPAPAAETDWEAGDDLEVMGWGISGFDPNDDGPIFPDVLQHATVDRTADETCLDVWGPVNFHAEDMLCALRVTGDTVVDSCNGDSGGPLTTHVTGADPAVAADWQLVGTVSYGAEGCLDGDAPGVYGRAAEPSLNAFIGDFSDGLQESDPAAQVEWADGSPALTGTLRVGQQLTCAAATTTWTATPTAVSARVRRYDTDALELTTVATDAPYTLQPADEGGQFLCEVLATKTGDGGYGIARSDLMGPVAAAPATTTTTPVVTTPPPIIIVSPPPNDPPPAVPEPPRDTAAPRATLVSRSCTRTRRCTLTIAVADPAFSSGIKAVSAKITFRVRTLCRSGRRITRCTKSRTRFVTGRAVASQVFVVKTPRLYKGRTTISLTATDVAGNTQAVPTVARFRLR